LSILSKKIRDLSDGDRKSLSKPLGIKGRPYPMKFRGDIEKHGHQTYGSALGRLEADVSEGELPLIIYSEKNYAEVVGMAMREMPTPGMLPLFMDAINRRRVGSKRSVQYLKGDAGAGKTYMSELIGRMRSDKGPIVVNCGDKNISELLYETVLDFNNDRTFYDALDKKIVEFNRASGNKEEQDRILNPMVVDMLADALGEAFEKEESGRIGVDWERVKSAHKDDQDNYLSSKESNEIAAKGLLLVAKKLGLSDLAGNALGMITQEGPLIQGWKQGREVILDEYNKSKAGTDGGMQGVLQFLAGEIDKATVENTLKEKGDKSNQSFQFRREDQKVGFFVTLTGNSETDGETTRDLSQSVHSRVHPQFIPTATEEDWQHRICQILTGLPVSTIYKASENVWKENPEAFGEKLLEWRKIGLEPEEVQNIPEVQISLLKRWDSLLEASEKLARFYYGWSQIVDPESALYQKATNLMDLMQEIDDRYSGEVSIDFRKILDHVKDALENRPNVNYGTSSSEFDLGSWDDAPEIELNIFEEDPTLEFGTRLSSVIREHIDKTTIDIGKKGLHRRLVQHARDCGLIETQYQEGSARQSKLVSELLDNNPYISDEPSVQAELIRDILCDYLRSVHDNISENNNDIMSIAMVLKTMEAIKALEKDGLSNENNSEPRSIKLFNENLNDILHSPVSEGEIIDSILKEANDKAQKRELVSGKSVLASLAAPVLRKGNLKSFWSDALSTSDLLSAGNDSDIKDIGLEIAQGSSKSGIAMTTLMVKGDSGEDAPMHLIWNKVNDRLLVVGEGKLDSSISKSFKHNKTFYIDRTEAGAKEKVETLLPKVLSSNVNNNKSFLKNAFLLRNKTGSWEEDNTKSLAKLLVSKKVNNFLPQYVFKKENNLIKPKAA
jgi:hypothetical protein